MASDILSYNVVQESRIMRGYPSRDIAVSDRQPGDLIYSDLSVLITTSTVPPTVTSLALTQVSLRYCI